MSQTTLLSPAATAPSSQPTAYRVEPPTVAAHVIASDGEAIAVAHRLAAQFLQGALLRDRERRLPWAELDDLAASGLLAIRVPRAYGGPEVSYLTVARVVAIVSAADASLGQLFLSILLANSIVDAVGQPAQKSAFFAKVLFGYRWGNGHAEGGGRQAGVTTTRIARRGDRFVVNGQKFYSTGALFSHIISVGAVDEDGRFVTAVLDRHAPGLSILDDWDGFGQRTTASGTLLLDNVEVEASHVLDTERARTASNSFGIPDLVHSAIDLGIARAAVDDAIAYVRDHARAHRRAGVEHAVQDPYIQQEIGNLVTRLHAGEALLERGARLFDASVARGDEASRAEAVVALAEAKILTTEAALLASNKIFQLGGASSTRAEHGYDRHWRNARTHTVHDPVHWKFPLIGNHYLNVEGAGRA